MKRIVMAGLLTGGTWSVTVRIGKVCINTTTPVYHAAREGVVHVISGVSLRHLDFHLRPAAHALA